MVTRFGAIFVVALGLTLPVSACGGSTRRDSLERALLKTSVEMCGLDCKRFAMADARCGHESVRIDGRRWRRCLMVYEDGGPREYVCAARTSDSRGYAVREKRDCRPLVG